MELLTGRYENLWILLMVRQLRLRKHLSARRWVTYLTLGVPMFLGLFGWAIAKLAAGRTEDFAADFGAAYAGIALAGVNVAVLTSICVSAYMVIQDRWLLGLLSLSSISQREVLGTALCYGIWLGATISIATAPALFSTLNVLVGGAEAVGVVLVASISTLVYTSVACLVSLVLGGARSLVAALALSGAPWIEMIYSTVNRRDAVLIPVEIGGDFVRVSVSSLWIYIVGAVAFLILLVVGQTRVTQRPNFLVTTRTTIGLRALRAAVSKTSIGFRALVFLSSRHGRSVMVVTTVYMLLAALYLALAPGAIDNRISAVGLPLSFCFVTLGLATRPLSQSAECVYVESLSGFPYLRTWLRTVGAAGAFYGLLVSAFLTFAFVAGASPAAMIAVVLSGAFAVASGWFVSIFVDRSFESVPHQVLGSSIGAAMVLFMGAFAAPDESPGAWLFGLSSLLVVGVAGEVFRLRRHHRRPIGFLGQVVGG